MTRDGFFQLLYLELVLLSVAYLTAANLARLRIPVQCQVSVRSQYLVRLLSQCWITGGHTIHPPMEGLLSPTGIEPTPFRNLACKVAGLQVHATTPGHVLYCTKYDNVLCLYCTKSERVIDLIIKVLIMPCSKEQRQNDSKFLNITLCSLSLATHAIAIISPF